MRAANESIKWIKAAHSLLDKMGRDKIAAIIARSDALAASAMIREAMMG